jgi:hypothetical protein
MVFKRTTQSSAGGGSGGVSGLTFTSKTTTYTAVSGDFVLADATSGGFTVTLPASPTANVSRVGVKKVDSSANVVTVVAAGKTIDGDANATIVSRNAGAIFEYDGTNWKIASVTSGDGSGISNFYQVPASGDWMTSQWGGGNTTDGTVLNMMNAMPIYIPALTTFNSIAITVNSTAVGGVHRLGIYGSTAGNRPGTLVLDAGTVDSSTTGVKQISISQTLSAGIHWLVAVPQTALAHYRGFQSFLGFPPLGASNSVIQTPQQNQYRVASVSGALPASPTWTFAGNANIADMPIVGLVVA